MKHLMRLDELVKSDYYLKSAATKQAVELSRAVEEKVSPKGWKLLGFYPATDQGDIRGEVIPTKKFVIDKGVDLDSIKNALTTSMGLIFNQEWIDDWEVPSDKDYSLVFLGKLGVLVKSQVWVPMFEYPSQKQIKGDSLWMSVTSFQNRDTEEIVQTARAVAIYDYSLSDSELEKQSRIRVNAALKTNWERLRQEAVKAGNLPSKIPPKQFTDLEFSKNFRVIRETKHKDFFLIYKDSLKPEDVEEYATYMVTGKKVIKPGAKTVMEVGDELSRARREHGSFFSLNPTDERLRIFYYFNTDDTKKMFNLNNFTTCRIIPGTVKKSRKMPEDYREFSVETITGPKPGTRITLKLKVGDKIKIPSIRGRAAGEIELGGDKKPLYKEATVIKTEDTSTNKEKIAVRVID